MSTPIVAEGVVYAHVRRLYAFDAKSGEMKWQSSCYVDSLPAVVGGMLYVGGPASDGYANNLFALDARSGRVKWKVRIGTRGREDPAPPVFIDGMIYIGSPNNPLYGINSNDGNIEWSFEIEEGTGASAVVVGGVVYVSGRDGCVYAISSASED